MGGGKSKKVRVPVYPAIEGPMVAQMVARANKAMENVGVPTLAELFPYMSQNPFLGMQQGTIPTNNMMGAGRFLGQGMTGMQQVPTNMPSMPQGMGYSPQQSAILNSIMNPGMNAPSQFNQIYGRDVSSTGSWFPDEKYKNPLMSIFANGVRSVPEGTKAMSGK
jgi:hypothetical protein